MKEFVLTISGPDAVIDGALDAYVRRYGWTATVPGDSEEEPTKPHPMTQEQYARFALRAHVMDAVTSQFVADAKSQAEAVAKAGASAAIDTTTMTLEVRAMNEREAVS
jgi:hypothetical protein